ncbi:hypothetical protein ACTHGU_03280 [Chitinophagaceae bacterium MMS25-I14]
MHISTMSCCVLLLLLTSCHNNSGKADGTVTANTDNTTIQHTDIVKSVALRDTTAPAMNMLIVPGRSAGKTALGENMDSVLQILGKPDDEDAAMGKAMYVWYRNHNKNSYETNIYTSRQMGMDETSRVRQIRVSSPDFKTAAGLHVGSYLKDLQIACKLKKAASYTKAGKRFTIYESADGIAFETGPDNICVAVIVMEAGKSVNTAYLSFHPEAVMDNQ